MTVRPVLIRNSPRKDGKCLVRLYVYHKGKQKYVSIGIHVLPEDWDDKSNRVKKSNPLSIALNATIKQKVLETEQSILGINGSLLSFIDSYIIDCKRGSIPVKPPTIKEYKKHLNRLRGFCEKEGKKDIYFLDINANFYRSFTNYLAERGNAIPSIDNHIKWLKKFMGEAHDKGLHQNGFYKKKEFKRLRGGSTDKIYLTKEEVGQIRDVDLSDMSDGHQLERDRWLVSYYLLMRFTDSTRIREDLFFESNGHRFYRNNAIKTSQTKYVPVGAVCWEIVNRNGFDFKGSNAVANRYIKVVAKKAGIDSLVNRVEKWRLITTHTARRSMATHLHQSGMDIKTIMQLGGWKSEKAFKAYLLSSDMQLALQAASSPLFK